ncbi:MAG: hypothetical protein ACYDA8_16215, partial [Deferrisomatales bacterium]
VYLERAGDGTCGRARVVLGALGPAPLRVPEAEAAITGSRLEAPALEAAAQAARGAARPAKNADLTPGYRRQVAGVLVTRAARRAWNRATGESEAGCGGRDS